MNVNVSSNRKGVIIGLVCLDFVLIQAAGLLTFVILHSMMIDEVVLVSFLSTVITVIILALMKFYRYKIRRSSVELSVVCSCAFCFAGLIVVLIISLVPSIPKIAAVYILYTQMSGLLLVLGSRLLFIFFSRLYGGKRASQYPETIVYGAGEIGHTLARQYVDGKLEYDLVGFIDDDDSIRGTFIQSIPVLGSLDDLSAILHKHYEVKQLIIGITDLSQDKLYQAIDIAKNADCDIKIIPSLYEIQNGAREFDIRNLDYQDLLGRSLIQVDKAPVEAMVKDKIALVTGACGSIGSEICKQLVSLGVRQLIMIDIDESGLHDMGLRLSGYQTEISDMIVPILCDIKNKDKVMRIFSQFHPELVYHAAAYKHVPMGEREPDEIIRNNVLGSYNVLYAAKESRVSKVVVISTDKAVNPTNVMGASKRMVELIASMLTTESTEIVAVRFGNVLGSRGSMLPLFIEQIHAGVPITVTHKDIIRYFMAIPEAVSLVLKAGAMAEGGEVMVLDMGKPVNIYNFAERLIKYYGDENSKIVITGLRPGEKLYEELLADEDLTIPTDDKLVFKAKLNDHKLMPEEFNEFLNSINEYSESELVERLQYFVPEFKNQGSKIILEDN